MYAVTTENSQLYQLRVVVELNINAVQVDMQIVTRRGETWISK